MAQAVVRFLAAVPAAMARFVRETRAVTAIEYGLIAACVALAFVSIAILLGDDIGSMFENIGESVQNASGGD